MAIVWPCSLRLVACPPPAQRRGASYGDGATVPGLGGEGGVHKEWPGPRPESGGRVAGLVHGRSRVSSATAFLAQASSTRSLPAAAAAMSAATAGVVERAGQPVGDTVQPGDRVIGEQRLLAPGQLQVMPQVGGGLGEVHRLDHEPGRDPLVERGEHAHPQLPVQGRLPGQDGPVGRPPSTSTRPWPNGTGSSPASTPSAPLTSRPNSTRNCSRPSPRSPVSSAGRTTPATAPA